SPTPERGLSPRGPRHGYAVQSGVDRPVAETARRSGVGSDASPRDDPGERLSRSPSALALAAADGGSPRGFFNIETTARRQSCPLTHAGSRTRWTRESPSPASSPISRG